MWDWINEKTYKWEQNLIDEGNNTLAEQLLKPIGEFFVYVGKESWNWFIEYLPDMVGYGTMATGAFIILGSMVDKGGLMKPLSYYTCGLVASLCILMSVK